MEGACACRVCVVKEGAKKVLCGRRCMQEEEDGIAGRDEMLWLSAVTNSLV